MSKPKLSEVHYQVLLGVDTYDTDANAINKLVNLFYYVFSYYVSSRVLRVCFSLNKVCYWT